MFDGFWAPRTMLQKGFWATLSLRDPGLRKPSEARALTLNVFRKSPAPKILEFTVIQVRGCVSAFSRAPPRIIE